MATLAIETATTSCAIGLRVRDGDRVTTLARVLDHERRHTESLTAGVRAALAETGRTAADLDRVVVDRGPGLFTGLRVGLATAQALAQGLGVTLVGVSSLDVLAHGAFAAGVRGALVAVVDARRGEVFARTYALDDEVTATDGARVTTAVALVAAHTGTDVTYSGDGALRYRTILAPVARAICEVDVPPVGALLDLGEAATGDAPATPLYLREADAVAHFVTRAGT